MAYSARARYTRATCLLTYLLTYLQGHGLQCPSELHPHQVREKKGVAFYGSY